jgi:hypothetical protein
MPIWGARLRLRPVAWVLVLAGVGLAALGVFGGWAVTGAAVLGVLLETVVLRGRVTRALAVTTEGATG